MNKSIKEKLKYISLFHKVPSEIFNSDDAQKQFECPQSALKHFLDYAFERAGSAAAFKYMGKQAVEKTKIDFENITKEKINNLWKNYKGLAEQNNLIEKGENGETKFLLNKDRNLFYSSNNNKTSKKQSILDVFNNYDDNDKIVNMAEWCRDKIKENKIKDAYKRLIKIRGIGPKIASLYLRDIYYVSKIEVEKLDNFYLLQPIDTWIAQAFEIIFKNKPISFKNLSTDKKRKEVQENICEECLKYNVSPIEFNKGAWYFGSIISRTYNRMKNALDNKKNAKDLIKEIIIKNQKEINELKKVMQISE